MIKYGEGFFFLAQNLPPVAVMLKCIKFKKVMKNLKKWGIDL